MAALAGTMLVWPGTKLDGLWSLNQTAHAELAKNGNYLGPLFWVLSLTLAGTALGWFKRRVWAYRLTVIIMCTQVAGDLVNLARGDFWRGGAGVLIAGALLVYLLSSDVRAAFQ
jgi:mannose/fructose/N-acetylgalactosamine-specific phosphotransferase system component IID